MMRSIALALTFALATNAFGATKEDLDLQKAEVKYAKDVSKSVSKLVKSWHKNADKDKDNGDVNKELKDYYRNELAWLREKGVPTVGDDAAPANPRFPAQVLPEPESETPKMESLRDLVVELKSGDLKDKAKGKKLDEYAKKLDSRYERKDAAYKAAK